MSLIHSQFAQHMGRRILHDGKEYILDGVRLSHLEAIDEWLNRYAFVIDDCKIIVEDLRMVEKERYQPILCVYKLKDEYVPATKSIKAKENAIIEKLCECSGITEETLFSLNKTRKREEVYARQIHMSVRHLLMRYTLASSASVYGLDHATTLNSIKQVKNLIEMDKSWMFTYRPVFEVIVKEFGYSAVYKFGLQKYFPKVKKEGEFVAV